MNFEDILCTSETIWRLTSLGQEEMLDAAGIDRFNYDPRVGHSNVALEDAKAREAFTEDAKATPTEQDLIVLLIPKGETII